MKKIDFLNCIKVFIKKYNCMKKIDFLNCIKVFIKKIQLIINLIKKYN